MRVSGTLLLLDKPRPGPIEVYCSKNVNSSKSSEINLYYSNHTSIPEIISVKGGRQCCISAMVEYTPWQNVRRGGKERYQISRLAPGNHPHISSLA